MPVPRAQIPPEVKRHRVASRVTQQTAAATSEQTTEEPEAVAVEEDESVTRPSLTQAELSLLFSFSNPPPASAISAFANRLAQSVTTSASLSHDLALVEQCLIHESFWTGVAHLPPSASSTRRQYTNFHDSPLTTSPSASPAYAHNGALASLGNALLGTFACELVSTSFPNLPTRVSKAALSLYVGPKTLANVATNWGVKPTRLDLRDVGRPDEETRKLSRKEKAYGHLVNGVGGARKKDRTLEGAAGPGLVRWNRRPTTPFKDAVLLEDALASVARAIVGAVYQTHGLAAARSFVHAHFLNRLLTSPTSQQASILAAQDIVPLLKFTNPIKILSDTLYKHQMSKPVHRLLKESGRLSAYPTFVTGVFSDSLKLGEGFGSSIKMSEWRASEDALRRLYLSGGKAPLRGSLPSEGAVASSAATVGHVEVDYQSRSTTTEYRTRTEDAKSIMSNPYPIPTPEVDLSKQGIPVPGTGRKGETPIYKSAAFYNANLTEHGVTTAYHGFELGLKHNPEAPCMGSRPWDSAKGDWSTTFEWMTYNQVAERRTNLGAGVMKLAQDGVLGQGVTDHFVIGVWCTNRPEWQLVNQGAAAYSNTLVSLYDTLGPNVVEYCINHSQTRIVFAAATHIPKLLKLAKQIPSVKAIVCVESWDSIAAKATRPHSSAEQTFKEWGASQDVAVYDITEIEDLGAKNPLPHQPPTPQDMGMICYTSGTTGNPKGAVLRHSALAAAAIATLHGGSMSVGEIYFSYLPLSHIYERFCEDSCLTAGVAIGYSCGDNLRLLEDMQLLGPTIFASVPRVLNRIYQALKAATIDAPGLKGKLARKAFADKLSNLRENGSHTHAFWDRIIFNKVKKAVGGRLKWISSGSAPINPDVLDFLKVAFSCSVTEGYGQTENCGTCVVCLEHDNKPNGTVGPPRAGVELKLVDVPDMEYFTTDKPYPRGEIMARGAMVISEYLHEPEKTKETVTEDGWLHTGDIGLIDEAGRLKIIDRIKNLVKLSQGEYVALEKVENVYGLCPLIAQIYIHGDSLRDHVVAIVVPDPATFAPFASRVLGQQIPATDVSALLNASRDKRVINALAKELEPYARDARLLKYEAIGQDIYLHLDPFTSENDLLTPTFKTKRNVAAKVFKDQIRQLYEQSERVQKAIEKL
ncbi:medium-chain fatty acid-CoA ligase faa2 [Microbotryomycetes sp. JL221]|nr:medium-chain fatty acid-CoA ligase faa2 [Microbotryomycetes sp. JL221]